jgi:hypothetical protein
MQLIEAYHSFIQIDTTTSIPNMWINTSLLYPSKFYVHGLIQHSSGAQQLPDSNRFQQQ